MGNEELPQQREESDGETHIYPINDKKENCTNGAVCWCRPLVENHGGSVIVIYNSLDRRELY